MIDSKIIKYLIHFFIISIKFLKKDKILIYFQR